VPAPAPAAPVLARLHGAFTDIEEDALAPDGLPFDAAPLRDALGTRLRTALALELALQKPGEKLDTEAVNALLADVDGVLDRLRALEGLELQGAVLERVQLHRDQLVKDAVRLSEVATARGGPPAPGPAAPAVTRKKAAAAATAGKVVMLSAKEEAAEGARKRKQGLMVGATVALMLLTGGLQVYQRAAARRDVPTVPGAPEGVAVNTDARGGLVVRLRGNTDAKGAADAWAAGYVARGYRKLDLGSGAFYLSPPSTPAAAQGSPQ
jgi:hypothetical protein